MNSIISKLNDFFLNGFSGSPSRLRMEIESLRSELSHSEAELERMSEMFEAVCEEYEDLRQALITIREVVEDVSDEFDLDSL